MSERFQVATERTASGIYWWIHDYAERNGRKFWSVVLTNPIRVDVCARGELPSSVEIVTANIFDWVCQDDEGNFYVETNEGTRKEPIKRVIPEPTFTKADLEQLIEAIAARVEGIRISPEMGIRLIGVVDLIGLRDEAVRRIRSTKI